MNAKRQFSSPRAFRKIIAAVQMTVALSACGGGGYGSPQVAGISNTPSDPSPSALSLSWATSTQPASTSPAIALGTPGSATVIPAGVAPYQATISGNCATLPQASTSSIFTVNVGSGFCAITVQDNAGRFRALQIEGTPPRAFLGISPTGLTDPTGTVQLSVGSTLNLTVDEPLVDKSFNTPYGATVQGTCVTESSISASPSGPTSVSIAASAAGQCVAIFTDSAGQALPLNFTVH